MTSSPSNSIEARQRWMSVLAKAEPFELESCIESMCKALGALPDYNWLRCPETGLVMVQGRIGGTGERFNVGEMSVTRCALSVNGGATGFGYVRGRSHRHAELAAIVDALMQDAARRSHTDSAIVSPLERLQQARRTLTQRKAQATRVEFYTLVRGEAA